jgi:uncharacterized membrane protein
MPRILVTREDGEVFWNEGVTAKDFETEHFRRCLADRLGWAVADAETRSVPATVSTLGPLGWHAAPTPNRFEHGLTLAA